MKVYEYESLGNDLFCKIGECKCPHRLFIGSDIEYIMKENIKLSGYNDDYFFNEVNKDFRNYRCSGCGINFDYKWTIEGVLVKNYKE